MSYTDTSDMRPRGDRAPPPFDLPATLRRMEGNAGLAMRSRFRGYLPVVIDIETGGFEPGSHALLELAAVTLDLEGGRLTAKEAHRWAIAPHPETRVEAASLQVTGIDLDDPVRNAVPEEKAVRELFRVVRREIKQARCQRAILTAHNAHFDHAFLRKAAARNGVKRDPFHPFSVMDTVALAGVACGHTVLREACNRAGIAFDPERAHSAAYDAQMTATLFCAIVNAWPSPRSLGGGS